MRLDRTAPRGVRGTPQVFLAVVCQSGEPVAMAREAFVLFIERNHRGIV